MIRNRQQTALITGASSGLGVEFARLFAADGHDVVLIARRQERLEQLATELRRAHGIRAEAIALDLTEPGAVGRLLAELGRLGVEVAYLVNNAGFGKRGAFTEIDDATSIEMIQLNVMALVSLTRALLPPMLARGYGRILNVGSTAGFQPGPFMAVYYATKAFVNSFTEALAYELDGTGVTATVACPGPTDTEFTQRAGNRASRLFRIRPVASASAVARHAYDAMHDGRAIVVYGFFNQLGVALLRIAPRSLVRGITAALNRDSARQRLDMGA